MKTFESFSGQKPLPCDQCELSFSKVSELSIHQMRFHHDTWAVIDLLEAGVSDKEASQLYEKCTRNNNVKWGRGRKRALVDNSPIIENPEKNQQIRQLFSQLGALHSSAHNPPMIKAEPEMEEQLNPCFMPKAEPKVEFEDQEFCVKMEEPMNGSWIVNEDVFHNDVTDDAADTGISDNNQDNQKLMEVPAAFELSAKDNEDCKETQSLRGQSIPNEDINNSEKKLGLSLKLEDEVEIIQNNAMYQKTLASEIFDASVLTFKDSNEKEIQRLAREIDEMLEQEMASLVDYGGQGL